MTAAKVKPHSLLARDFRHGQRPAGPAGPAGPGGSTGPQGAAGSAFAYARIATSGLIADQSRNVASAKVILGGACLTVDGTPRNATATIELTGTDQGGVGQVSLDPTVIAAAISSGQCPAGTNVLVGTFDSNGSGRNYPFFIAFN